jgi:hypothetical protein
MAKKLALLPGAVSQYGFCPLAASESLFTPVEYDKNTEFRKKTFFLAREQNP